MWWTRPASTFPATPVQSNGIRTVKSPALTWAKTPRRTVASMSSMSSMSVTTVDPAEFGT